MISVMLGSASSASSGPNPRTSSRTESTSRSLSALVIVIAVVRKYSSASSRIFSRTPLLLLESIWSANFSMSLAWICTFAAVRAGPHPPAGGGGGARGQAGRRSRRLDRSGRAGDLDRGRRRIWRTARGGCHGPVGRGGGGHGYARLVLLAPVQQAHVSYCPGAAGIESDRRTPGPREFGNPGSSQSREAVLEVDLLEAHAVRILDGLARGIRRSRRLLQVVVEGLQRVADRHVLEKPGHELRVALCDLDREAGCEPAGRPLGPPGCGSAAGGLHVGDRRAEPDDVDVGEHGLAHDLRRSRRDDHVGRGDDSAVVAQSDSAGDALLLTGGDRHGYVAAGEREVCRRGSGPEQADVPGQHVGGDQ